MTPPPPVLPVHVSRIDAHQHFWRLSRGDYGWLTPALGAIYRDFLPEDLAPLLAATGMEKTILVQAAPSVAETEFLLKLARNTPFVAGVVGWADFTAPSACSTLKRLAADPLLVGLRPMIHDMPDPDWMLRPELGQALQAMQREGLVFDALVRPQHLSRLLTLADRHPELTIVIDHGAKPRIAEGNLDPWRADMAALGARGTLHCKLSGIVTEAGDSWDQDKLHPYVDHLISTFGPSRLIFGSDWPVCTLATPYEDWLATAEACCDGLRLEERAAIFGGNAERVYLSRRGRR